MANRESIPQPQYGPVLYTKSFSEIPCRRTEWLWENWLPLGNVCLMAGDGGTGKSTILCDLAARVSRGDGFPCEGENLLGRPGHVLIFNPEDNVDTVLKPRLIAAGADMDYIHTAVAHGGTLVDEHGEETRLPIKEIMSLDQGTAVDAMMLWIRARCDDTALIIIDPVTSFLGGVDANSNAEVKCFISAMQTVARNTNTCVLLVTHLNKNMEAEAQGRVIGSCAWVHGPRNILMVTANKDAIAAVKENTEVKYEPCISILSNPKNNLGRKPLPIGFQVQDTIVETSDGHSIHIGMTEWGTALDTSWTAPVKSERLERIEMKAWCLKMIVPGAPATSPEIFRLAERDGFTEPRARRALLELVEEGRLISEQWGRGRKWIRTSTQLPGMAKKDPDVEGAPAVAIKDPDVGGEVAKSQG